MMFLPGLAVVFAGLLGGKGDVARQVTKIVRDLHVEVKPLPAAKLHTLTHHSDATRDVVRGLHADGVIAFEVVKGKTLRLVIYEGDGRLKTFTELPLSRHGLTADDLDVLRENLHDDVVALRGSDDDEPQIAAAPAPRETPAQRETPAPAKRPAPPRQQVAMKSSPPATMDDEDPFAGENAGSDDAASPTEVAAAGDAADADDAVSADEIAALVAGGEDEEPAVTQARALHLGISAGLGIAGRSFQPGPATVTPYASSPVPAVVLDLRIQPTKRLAIQIGTERTLQLSTEMADGDAADTTISRWEASADYALLNKGALAIAARFGGGRRSFTIDSLDPGRSPDGEYNYVIAGVAANAKVSPRVVLRAHGALEPVLFGTEPTEMAFGEATRWALEVGAAVDVRPWTHVFVRAAALYQRFSWSWDMAGERGAGGAIDVYPSGALSLGADY